MIEVVIACLVFIVLDVVSGICAAAKNHELDSTVMRKGLFNKLGEIVVLIVAMLAYGLLMEPPFDRLGIPAEVLFSVGAYIIVMELVSVIENACKLNEDLPFSKFLSFFNVSVDKTEEDE